jgi:hypothetical protein
MRTATRPERRGIDLDRNPSGAGNGLDAAIAKAAVLVRKADGAPTAAGWQREQGPVRTLQRLARRAKRPGVIAPGAGTDFPSVRRLCESLRATADPYQSARTEASIGLQRRHCGKHTRLLTVFAPCPCSGKNISL